MNNDFFSLLKLLDDENDQSAAMAMAELLRHADSRLERVLRTLQETSNPKLRRRIHQLQSAILRRRRRKNFSQTLEKSDLALYDGLVQFHLFWFDNDTAREVNAQWDRFVRASGNGKISSVSDLFPFLLKKITVCRGPLDGATAEEVCIGSVLEYGEGADFMICILAHLLAQKRGIETEIISTEGTFGLLEKKSIYFPIRKWEPFPVMLAHPLRRWKDSELLKLIGAVLFYNAVATDGYRYIHTLGSCLAQTDDLSFLPFPYGSQR